MPAEKFWPAGPVKSGSNPAIAVEWGSDDPQVRINDVGFDRSALNRLIRVIRNARDRTYGRDE